MNRLQLLRTYVRLVCERTRSKTFSVNVLQSMDDLSQIQDYALKNLEELGLGSSRAAYALSSRYVLKVAQNHRGVAQNQEEVQIAQDPAAARLVTRVVKAHPKYYWLISELVRPLTDEREFESLTGYSLEDFAEDIKSGHPVTRLGRFVLNVARKTGLELQDLIRISSWGRSADGRLVLLDSGYTSTSKAAYRKAA